VPSGGVGFTRNGGATGTSTGEGYFVGLSVASVPEPSTYGVDSYGWSRVAALEAPEDYPVDFIFPLCLPGSVVCSTEFCLKTAQRSGSRAYGLAGGAAFACRATKSVEERLSGESEPCVVMRRVPGAMSFFNSESMGGGS